MLNDRLAHFCNRVEKFSVTGLNGHFQEVQYVPYSVLEEYWTAENIRGIINCLVPQINVSTEQIQSTFLRIFSILVYIGQPQDITLFIKQDLNDQKLPLGKLPQEWCNSIDTAVAKQWAFWPLDFDKGHLNTRELPAQTILPVKKIKTLAREDWGSNAAEVCLVEIHDGYNRLVPSDHRAVFKIYSGLDAMKDYNAEADVYAILGPKCNPSITKCYGSFSFEETDKRIIMLEYASEGSLLDFLEKIPSPVLPEDFLMLWDHLLELLDGLHALHNLDQSESRIVAGIHQDIQLANILVFRLSQHSRFDVSFKLADFGMAEVKRRLTPEGAVAIQNEGNRMYSAPECYVNDTTESVTRPRVKSLADLWSLGAVFSDVLVWSIGGETNREKYRKRRRDAIAKLTDLKESGFDACFHDGMKRLPAVDKFHEEILAHARATDYVSPCMSRFILEFMMTDVEYRLEAMSAKKHAKRKINEERLGSASDRPRTPETRQSSHRDRHSQARFSPTAQLANNRRAFPNGTLNPEEHISIEQYYEYLEKKGRKFPWGKGRGKKSDAGMEFPGMQEARRAITAEGGRDQIMLIDNFASMDPYRSQVAKAARVISYVVKLADEDGMDLYFASDSCKPQKCSSSTAVESAIKSTKTVLGDCNMQKCLENIMDRVCNNGMKPTSIYIFTDGVWVQSSNPTLDDHRVHVGMVIKQSILRLASRQQLPTKLMFQFIQFGHDIVGTERLRYLDDDCVSTQDLGEYDIVDTKHYDDHVPEIVIGSISKLNDAKNRGSALYRR